MMDSMTPELMSQKEYISALGVKCPVCKKDSVEGGSRNLFAETMVQDCSCLSCDATSQDIYKLSGYDSVSYDEDAVYPGGNQMDDATSQKLIGSGGLLVLNDEEQPVK